MEKLLQMVENKVTAVRDGKEVEISLHGIVPGDLVILRAGDIIPADCGDHRSQPHFFVD